MQRHITFLGGGNMANALVSGLIAHGHAPSHIHVVDRNADKCNAMIQTYGIHAGQDYIAALASADIVIIAVKPQGFSTLLEQTSSLLISRNPIIVSIMTGIRLSSLQTALPAQSIIRAMPNTPARVQAGMTLLAPGILMHPEQLAQVQHIFEAVGQTIITSSERAFEQLTALTGCGPAFVFYWVDMLAKAMQEITPDIDCLPLALATCQGALSLMSKETLPVDALIAQVSPKGGMTAEAMTVLHTGELQTLLKKTFEAAIQRSDELRSSLQ